MLTLVALVACVVVVAALLGSIVYGDEPELVIPPLILLPFPGTWAGLTIAREYGLRWLPAAAVAVVLVVALPGVVGSVRCRLEREAAE